MNLGFIRNCSASRAILNITGLPWRRYTSFYGLTILKTFCWKNTSHHCILLSQMHSKPLQSINSKMIQSMNRIVLVYTNKLRFKIYCLDSCILIRTCLGFVFVLMYKSSRHFLYDVQIFISPYIRQIYYSKKH